MIMVRSASKRDSRHIAAIYNHYILHSVATFEEDIIDENEMWSRIERVQQGFPWLVFEIENEIMGYAYATQWKPRAAYRYSAESTIYLRHDAGGRGIGFNLYSALIEHLQSENMHAIMGGISLPNPASVALHEKLGFEKVAHFKE